MRPEQFSLAVTNVAWVEAEDDPELPLASISTDGDASSLRDRLLQDGERDPAEGDVDLAVRLQRSAATGDAEAVVALTHRLTGDYILELTVDPETVLTFTRAARRYGEVTEADAWYRVRLLDGDEVLASFEKETLLVYGPDGELLRQHSLIPGGVEL